MISPSSHSSYTISSPWPASISSRRPSSYAYLYLCRNANCYCSTQRGAWSTVSDVRYALGALSTVPRKAATNALAPERQNRTSKQSRRNRRSAQGQSRYSLPQLARNATRGTEAIPRWRVGQLGCVCNGTLTSQEKLLRRCVRRATRVCFVCLSHHLHPRCGGEQHEPASPGPGRRTTRSP